MMLGNLFRMELACALGDRRRVLLRTGVSVLLALPFIFVAMPPQVKAGGLTMVILFTGFFGAAVHHARLRSDLRLARLYALPTRRGVVWLDLALSSMLARLVPALAVLACFVSANSVHPSIRDMAGVAGLLCAALLLLTLCGMAVGRLAQSNGEVHLFGGLAAGILAFVSGIAPLPERLGWLAATTSWNPIAQLLAALKALAVEQPAVDFRVLVAAVLTLVGVMAVAAQRWVSGGAGAIFKSADAAATIDNHASLEA
jgi:hypothetical protein